MNTMMIPVIIIMVISLIVVISKSKKSGIKTDVDGISLKEYEKYYDPKLIEEERIRQKKEKKFNSLYVILIVILLIFALPMILMLFTFIQEGNTMQGFMYFAFFIFIVTVIFIGVKNKEKSQAYKAVVIRKMLEEKYPNSTYNPLAGISSHDYAFKEYVSYYNRYYNEDFISFLLNDKYLVLSEVKTVHETTDSDGDTHRTTTFRGIVGYYELNRMFEINKLFIGDNTKFTKEKKLDNDVFNKLYDVICDNEISLFKLLTPSNMERLVKLKEKIPTIELLLTGNRLYFRFANADILEYKKDVQSSSVELYKFDMLLKTISNICLEIEKELIDKLS